jgi:predicted phosphodiesterase
MEKIAIISDVHANLAALEEALGAAEREGCERVWCLGDTFGYGKQPIECFERVLETCEIVLAGNHDLAVAGAIPGFDLSGHRLLLTRAPNGAELERRLLDLEPRRDLWLGGRHVMLVHASPADPVWAFIGTPQDWEDLALPMGALVICGHTHQPAAGVRDAVRTILTTRPYELERGLRVDRPTWAYLVNPGSVGGPSDFGRRASWALLTVAHGDRPLVVEWRLSEY